MPCYKNAGQVALVKFGNLTAQLLTEATLESDFLADCCGASASVAQAEVQQQYGLGSSFLASNARSTVSKEAARSALPSFDELLSDVACSGAASHLGWT